MVAAVHERGGRELMPHELRERRLRVERLRVVHEQLRRVRRLVAEVHGCRRRKARRSRARARGSGAGKPSG
jgi:hypothetical protein